MSVELHLGDCLEVMATLEENSIDTCITDPPYELGFMGKKWDSSGVAFQPETWQAVFRVLKPGAILLAFGGTRTYHRIVCAIEDAGFEIRDTFAWIYGQGFPKSYDIEKGGAGADWHGWGTALKPAFEPIVIAQKPIDGTYVNNALTWGVAGLWIDGCRVGQPFDGTRPKYRLTSKGAKGGAWANQEAPKMQRLEGVTAGNPQGRFPANFIHDGSDEVVGLFPNAKGNFATRGESKDGQIFGYGNDRGDEPRGYGDSGSAARFFYCAKSSRRERNMGLGDYLTVKYNNDKSNNGDLSWKDVNTAVVQLLRKVMSDTEALSFNIGESGESITVLCQKDSLSTTLTAISKTIESKILHSLTLSLTNDYTAGANCEIMNGGSLAESVESLRKWILTITNWQLELARGASSVALQMLLRIKSADAWSQATNFHSTVKPVALMRYLVRLTKTPTGGIVLDPFMGSGTTGIACELEGRDFIGIEREPEYVEIAEKRIAHYAKQPKQQEAFDGFD